MFNFIQTQELKDLVTFVPNKFEPVHNWYYYKEGFSRGLVDFFIRKFGIEKNSIILDPFCGVGTTLLACKQAGIRATGFDTSPLTVFVSQVKTADYNLKNLTEAVRAALKWKFARPRDIPTSPWLKRAFSKYALEDIIFYKGKILGVENPVERNFLSLGLMDAALRCSYIRKDGAVVKIRRGATAPVGKIFKYKIRRMLRDLREQKMQNTETRAEVGDARELPLENESVDFVVTSPPYLNKIEYTNIYKTEYELFFDLPATKLCSHIGDKIREISDGLEIEEIKNLPIAQSYFSDMKKVLLELKRVCRPEAKLAVVIGGGCFPDRAVLVDEILAKIAEQVGFSVREILIARNSWCTRNRTEKVGEIRESAVVMGK